MKRLVCVKVAATVWEIRQQMERDGWRIDIVQERGIVVVRGTSPGFHVSSFQGGCRGRLGTKAESEAFRDFLENIRPRYEKYLELME